MWSKMSQLCLKMRDLTDISDEDLSLEMWIYKFFRKLIY